MCKGGMRLLRHSRHSQLGHVRRSVVLSCVLLMCAWAAEAAGGTGSMNSAPTVSIVSPLSTARFRVGETITLQADATDLEDGPLPASALVWTVVRVHDTHTHPLMSATPGNGLTFSAPAPEDFAAAGNSYLQVRVTATDSGGLTTSVQQDLLPRLVNVTFDTDPAGLKVEVNGSTLTCPVTAVSWENYVLTVAAPNQLASGELWTFQSWSDGGASQHSVTTPDAPLTLTAAFIPLDGVPAGLVAAYAFDEGGGTFVNDVSGRGHIGAVTGASWMAAGRYGGALSFDGIDDWVTVDDAPDLDLTTGMTLEAWVYPTALGGGSWRNVLIKERAGGEIYNLYANANTDSPTVFVVAAAQPNSPIDLRGTTTLPLNTWSHLAATYDGTALRIYLNGIPFASRSVVGGPLLTSTGVLRIGGNAVWGEYFQGRIDDVRVYNRVLNQDEIQFDLATPIAVAQPPAQPGGVRIIR